VYPYAFEPCDRELFAMGYSQDEREKIINVALQHNFDPVAFGNALRLGGHYADSSGITICRDSSFAYPKPREKLDHYQRMMLHRGKDRRKYETR